MRNLMQNPHQRKGREMDRKGRVHLRVTEKEKAEFTSKAAAAGVALSEYLRQAALQIGVVHRYDQAAVHQFRKIGVNLNQIAHYLNAGNALESEALLALRRCLVKLEKELDTRPGSRPAPKAAEPAAVV
jgi:hypothetical protein